MLSQEIFRALFTGCVFGSILFFGTVVGPTIFRILDGDEAATFLRRLVPRYFLFVLINSGLGAFSSWEHPLQATGLAFIALTTLFVRQVALPQIFEWRDLQMDGNEDAAKKFRRGRNMALVLTGVQLVIAGAVLGRIAG